MRDYIEKETVLQHHNSRWHEYRQRLLPSPHFARIFKSKQMTSYKNMLEDIMYKRTEFGNNAQIKHERLVQRDGLAVFKNLFDEHVITECGLFIDKDTTFLCASPYKLYGNDHIVSIKCPLQQYNKSFDAAINKIPFWKKENDSYGINKQSDWYIEIQAEMKISDRRFAYLMVWLGEWEGQPQYRIVEIPRDTIFFGNILPKLTYFYNEVMLKELVNPRKERHMNLREYHAVSNSYI